MMRAMLVALGVLPLDDDLPVERKRDERRPSAPGSARQSPSPMNSPSPNTVTGPLSSAESVGFLRRTALNGKLALPRGLSAS